MGFCASDPAEMICFVKKILLIPKFRKNDFKPQKDLAAQASSPLPTTYIHFALLRHFEACLTRRYRLLHAELLCVDCVSGE